MSAHNGGYKVLCPACGGRMRVFTAEQQVVTPTAVEREVYAQCRDFFCSLSVTGKMAWTHVLKPSQLPDSACHLPHATSLLRAEAASKTSLQKNESPAKPSLAERVEECRAKGLSRVDTIVELGCTPLQLNKIWPTGVAPVRRMIEACRSAGMSREETRAKVKCDRKTFSLYWPAVAKSDTQPA